MVSSGLLRRVALIGTDVSEEPGASFIRVTKIGELETTQAATSSRRTLRRNTNGISSQRKLIFLGIPLGMTRLNHEIFGTIEIRSFLTNLITNHRSGKPCAIGLGNTFT
jgi:hypothetical protein